jgi:hypothetical protein
LSSIQEKKPTTRKKKVKKPTKTTEPGSNSKPPCKDNYLKVDEPIARAVQSYVVTYSKPQAKEKKWPSWRKA